MVQLSDSAHITERSNYRLNLPANQNAVGSLFSSSVSDLSLICCSTSVGPGERDVGRGGVEGTCWVELDSGGV